MHNGDLRSDEPRTSPRFVPEEELSVFLADRTASRLRGAVRNLSELGACVTTNGALQSGGAVTVDVRSGYSFLFRAEARIVWRAEARSRRESPECFHGMLFTDLSPFTRKLIRRLGGIEVKDQRPKAVAVDTLGWAAETDPDLDIWFREETSRKGPDDKFDLLSDPIELLMDAPDSDLPDLSGNLGYFTTTDVLQMLESSRATGILHLTGEGEGEIHVDNGRICGCFSEGLSREEAAFMLIFAEWGHFHFVPSQVRRNLSGGSSTTQLLLEAQLRLDRYRQG
jgi:hypothetical protein